MLRYFEAFLEYVRQQGMYIYRGDPAGVDFGIGDFTIDNAWHERDLAAIVPEHAKAVDVRLSVSSFANNEAADFRRHGQANEINTARIITQTGLIGMAADLTIPVDADRKFDYKIAVGGWTLFSFTVKGWWF